jgi:hypothetical protein
VHTNPTNSSSDASAPDADDDGDVDSALSLYTSTDEFHVQTDVDTFLMTETLRLELITGDDIVGKQVHSTMSVSLLAVHALATTLAGVVTENIDAQVAFGSWHDVRIVGAQTTDVLFAVQIL